MKESKRERGREAEREREKQRAEKDIQHRRNVKRGEREKRKIPAISGKNTFPRRLLN